MYIHVRTQPWYEYLEGQKHSLTDEEAKDKFLGVSWPAKLQRLAERQIAALAEDESRCPVCLCVCARVQSYCTCACARMCCRILHVHVLLVCLLCDRMTARPRKHDSIIP